MFDYCRVIAHSTCLFMLVILMYVVCCMNVVILMYIVCCMNDDRLCVRGEFSSLSRVSKFIFVTVTCECF